MLDIYRKWHTKEFGGIDLSGGEWQKIAIARSLLKDSYIYILDEPTAAIDRIKEAELYKKFFEICKNKTSIFVTHRLGSVLYSDLILFFKDGKITESGTHEELLALDGEYAQFWNTQSCFYVTIHSLPLCDAFIDILHETWFRFICKCLI